LIVTRQREQSVDAAIGARIRSLRIHNGLTQQSLADKLGVGVPQIRKYEWGENQISPTRLLKFANIFDVRAGFLLGEGTRKNPRAELPKLLLANPDKDAIKMLEAFQQLKDRKLRRQLSMLIQRIAESATRL
jgi:transcriptional regulator with XRE-family HTH domain